MDLRFMNETGNLQKRDLSLAQQVSDVSKNKTKIS